MAAAGTTAPFSADALNRYRLTHNDRELRPVIRRLNKLPYLNRPNEEGQAPDADTLAAETELARLEVEKWRFGVERMLASVGNLERQKDSYRRKADETVARTEALKQTLAEEKEQLAKGLAERDHRVKCDEVAKKIVARGKTRKELEGEIAALHTSITEHRASYEEVLGVAQARSDAFSRIVGLVEECRALKLPASATPEPMEVDPIPESSPARLSATSLPFQPSTSSSSSARPTSAPGSRSSTPAPSHGLPSRPQRSISSTSTGRYARGPAGLPPRPSNLRNVRPGNGLEDGEVGESEDGEVREGAKRKAADMESSSRSTRVRK